MSVRWNDRRTGEDRRAEPRGADRRDATRMAGLEPDEDPRNPWSAEKRAAIRRIRGKEEAA